MTTSTDITPAPRTLRAATAVACLAFGLASTASADTITVCLDGSCDFTSPAAAVAAASMGDVVEIAAGHYLLSQPLLVLQAIVVRGEVDANGDPATVLDGQASTQILSLAAVGPEAEFENLVITHGRADYGGAIFLYGASPVFRNCLITENRANWNGGAMFVNGSSPTLIDCELANNLASNSQFPGNGTGGAVFVGSGTLTLIDSAISANESALNGGGVFLSSAGILNLQSSRVCGNTASMNPQVGMNPGGVVNDLGLGCVMADCEDCPTAPPCPADLNMDGVVNGADLGIQLGWWGACKGGCAADLNEDGLVNGADLAMLLSVWGACD